MRRDLDAVAISIKAFVGSHVREECGVVPAAAGADGAGSCGGVKCRVFAIERRSGQRQIEVALYPCGEKLGGE